MHLQVCGFGIVQLVGFGFQRLQFLNGLRSFKIFFLTLVNLVFGRNPQHRSGLAHSQTFGIHDDLQRLIPRNIFQAQRESARHGVRSDDIEVGEISNHLQQRTHFDVLEVQREFLPRESRSLGQLAGINFLLPHFNDKLCVTLVGVMFPIPSRLNAHPHMLAMLRSRHCLHGGTKVNNIQLAAQSFWQ